MMKITTTNPVNQRTTKTKMALRGRHTNRGVNRHNDVAKSRQLHVARPLLQTEQLMKNQRPWLTLNAFSLATQTHPNFGSNTWPSTCHLQMFLLHVKLLIGHSIESNS